MSNLHRSLVNAQLCPRVMLSVIYLKDMPLSKTSIPCVNNNNNNNNNFYSRGFRVGSEHIYKPDGHNSVKHNTKHNIIITFLQHNAYRALYYS